MRILYIACGSGSDPTFGGSLTRTVEIATRLKDKHVVWLLTTTGGNCAIGGTIPTYIIDTPLGDYKIDKWYYIRQLWSYVCVFFQSMWIDLPEVDIVYLDSDGLWDIFPTIWYKIKHKDAIIISMNHHLVSKGRWLQNICHWLIKRVADHIFVLDTPIGIALANKLGKEFTYVQNGIDYYYISRVPEQKKIFDVCCFGTMRESKGLHDIMPIWRRVSKKMPNAKLLIIGDVKPKDWRFLQHHHIIITGYIPDKIDAIKVIKSCKMFISPSREEGWGIANMECIACDLFGVVWDLPTYKYMNIPAMIRVPLNNYDMFANQIMHILNYKTTILPRYDVIQYDWDNIVKKEVITYESLLCRKQFPPC